ncbi:hypothetical protein Q7P37_001620 [Cladosporium fusiforme]
MENSPLGRLPPEIRVMIFKEALTFGEVSYQRTWDNFQNSVGGKWNVYRDHHVKYSVEKSSALTENLGLTLACKGIRNECAYLLLEANTLHIRASDLQYNHTLDKVCERAQSAIKVIPEYFSSKHARFCINLDLGAVSLDRLHREGTEDWRARMNGSVSRIIKDVYPGKLAVVLSTGSIIDGCSWHSTKQERVSFPDRFELRIEKDSAGLRVLEEAIARKRQDMRGGHGTHEGVCTYDRRTFHGTEIELRTIMWIAMELMLTMQKAYYEAASLQA